MIPYQSPTGKTIYITTEEFLNMTDEKEQEYIANDSGYEVSNPFYHSSIDSGIEEVISDYLIIETIDLEDIEDININEDID
jgi:hypothetical protein